MTDQLNSLYWYRVGIGRLVMKTMRGAVRRELRRAVGRGQERTMG